MLDNVVRFLAGEINAFILAKTGADVVKVEPGPIVDDGGKWAVADRRVALTVVNVEEERTTRSQVPDRTYQNGVLVSLQPDLKLNVQILFASRHNDYAHALRYLSYVLLFFQARPSFAPEEFPALDPSIKRLSVELLTLGSEQLGQLWAYLGAKYLPSALYRVRMVVLQDLERSEIVPPVAVVDTEIAHK